MWFTLPAHLNDCMSNRCDGSCADASSLFSPPWLPSSWKDRSQESLHRLLLIVLFQPLRCLLHFFASTTFHKPFESTMESPIVLRLGPSWCPHHLVGFNRRSYSTPAAFEIRTFSLDEIGSNSCRHR